MPDEIVEKVARAIYEARGAHEPPRAWRKWEDIGDEARAVWCRCAVAALAVMECGGEAKGACPACGCEEANSRNLWTCECPAPRPEAVGEDGG